MTLPNSSPSHRYYADFSIFLCMADRGIQATATRSSVNTNTPHKNVPVYFRNFPSTEFILSPSPSLFSLHIAHNPLHSSVSHKFCQQTCPKSTYNRHELIYPKKSPPMSSKQEKGYPNGYPFSCLSSARRDSNPRPQPWQGCALPTEPLAHI